ncbi:TIGR00282 family metallophosphoesterase [Syntrophus aciditrophicus]|uniref:Calcineurin-like phosphoesterase n=1 Tax=Syntrophus aciditrophicus (strain SB) TaxID=56780 RepID=Q2LR99_SYNAS|nr:calcineurin-like phosphoesterase [Syntrophus aciditrophicus SB]OPY17215.1 MAG: hypothetical protein A4E74_01407 [Syntrophus sp. PtaB.Bin075]
MRFLFVGDIVGKPGRRAVRELLPRVLSLHEIDFVIANCENAASGFGITKDIVDELYQNHVDVLTSGNHIWDKKEIFEFLEDYETLLRPANYPEGTPGWGSVTVRTPAGINVGILNLAGRVFMQPIDCPFRTAEKELAGFTGKTNIIIVDIHAEATSEKKALGWFLDGRVSAVLGTHTHVQTADQEVLPGGTAYISDAGMTGPFDSVIGVKKDVVIEKFLLQIPKKFDIAKSDVRLQGVIFEVNEQDGKCSSIQRLSICLDN